MRAIVRPGLMVLTALLVLAAALSGHAQDPSTPKGATNLQGTAPAAARPSPAVLNQVLATVNGETITRRDLLEFLSQYDLPPDDREMIYNDSINTLINM